MTKTTEREIELWEEDQRLCDMANILLNLFAERKISVHDSLRTLEKAKKTIERSVQSTNWGSPLICELAQNEASVWSQEAVIAEIDRRKVQDTFQDC